jgi:hypothetical protein
VRAPHGHPGKPSHVVESMHQSPHPSLRLLGSVQDIQAGKTDALIVVSQSARDAQLSINHKVSSSSYYFSKARSLVCVRERRESSRGS